MSKQGGFSHILLVVLIIGIFAAVGFVGWQVFDAQQAEAPTTQPATTTTVDQSVESAADVSELENELNSVPIDEELDPSQLDQDVSDLQ